MRHLGKALARSLSERLRFLRRVDAVGRVGARPGARRAAGVETQPAPRGQRQKALVEHVRRQPGVPRKESLDSLVDAAVADTQRKGVKPPAAASIGRPHAATLKEMLDEGDDWIVEKTDARIALASSEFQKIAEPRDDSSTAKH